MIARQRQRQAAPAAADVQHRQVRPVEAELRGDVPLLGDLRLFQRLVAVREVGAGVLPVAIEEQAVEPAVQVVVVRDVAPRAVRRVVLVDAAPDDAEGGAQPGDRMARGVRHHVEREHLDHVVDAAAVRDQATVHVGLADRERRVQHQPADRPGIPQ